MKKYIVSILFVIAVVLGWSAQSVQANANAVSQVTTTANHTETPVHPKLPCIPPFCN